MSVQQCPSFKSINKVNAIIRISSNNINTVYLGSLVSILGILAGGKNKIHIKHLNILGGSVAHYKNISLLREGARLLKIF